MAVAQGKGIVHSAAAKLVDPILEDDQRERGECEGFGDRKGIPKKLSFQVSGDVQVNLLVRILTTTLHFLCRRPELFGKFLRNLQMSFAIGRLLRFPPGWTLADVPLPPRKV